MDRSGGSVLPRYVAELFWDVEPETVELERHSDYVLERVMSRGGRAAMTWLRTTYSLQRIQRFLEERGKRLPPREYAYWALIAGMDVSVSEGGGRPVWAGT